MVFLALLFLQLFISVDSFAISREYSTIRRQTSHHMVSGFDLLTLGDSIEFGFEQEQNLMPDPSPLLRPDVEAEVMVDMSHVILDFSTFFSTSKSLLRFFSVFGRILVIYADYLPDHNILPEELAIQLFLLGVSMNEIVKSVLQNMQRSRN